MAAIQIAIAGIQGKMGQLAQQVIAAHPELNVVAGITRHDDCAKILQQHQPDVLLDLTAPDCVFQHSKLALELGIRPVIGTSGLQPQEIEALQDLAATQQLGGIIAPNFSIAAVLMMHCSALCAQYLANASIIEQHHPRKKDAPSATALKTAALIAQHRQQHPTQHDSQEHLPGVLGHCYDGVPIHSLRQPGVIADQTVTFAGEAEQLTLQHRTQDRQCFGPGMILSCLQVMRLNTLVYGLEQVMFQPVAQ